MLSYPTLPPLNSFGANKNLPIFPSEGVGMSLTLTSPAQTAQVVVTLQLHWTLNSREVPEKQVKNTDIEKLPRFSIPQET